MPTQTLPKDLPDERKREEHNQMRFKLNKKEGLLYHQKWKTLIPFLEQISSQYSVQVLLWNVLAKCFIYEVDKRGVTGYDASFYLGANGVDFPFSNSNPYFSAASISLQQKGFEYFLSNKQHVNNTTLNLDGVYRKSSGQYIQFLQQTICMEANKNGYPLLLLSYIHDISYFKKERTTNLVVTTPDNIEWWNYNFNSNCIEPVQPLSKQEKIILSYLATGKSSKEIAKALFISPLTIDTHRRHLLHKTNCLNTTGMITYVKLVGLL